MKIEAPKLLLTSTKIEYHDLIVWNWSIKFLNLWVKLNGGDVQKVLGWSSPKVSVLIT